MVLVYVSMDPDLEITRDVYYMGLCLNNVIKYVQKNWSFKIWFFLQSEK